MKKFKIFAVVIFLVATTCAFATNQNRNVVAKGNKALVHYGWGKPVGPCNQYLISFGADCDAAGFGPICTVANGSATAYWTQYSCLIEDEDMIMREIP